MCPTPEVINSSHQNVKKKVELAGLFLEVLWDGMTIAQAIYSTGEQCVNVMGNFLQTESGVTKWQTNEQHWANVHLLHP